MGIAFNHAILQVILNGNTYWIDPTINYQGGSIKETYCPDYCYGLVLKKDTKDLAEIPPSALPEIETISTFTYENDDNMDMDLEVVTIYKGGNANRMRAYFKNTGLQTISSNTKNFYSNIFGVINELKPASIEDNRDLNEIVFNEYYHIENFWEKEDNSNSKQMTLYPYNIKSYLTAEVDVNRTTPLAHVYPHKYKEVFHFIKRWTIRFPQNDTKKFGNNSFEYNVGLSTEGERLTVSYEYQSLDSQVKLNEVLNHREELSSAWNSSFCNISETKHIETKRFNFFEFLKIALGVTVIGFYLSNFFNMVYKWFKG